MRQVHFLTTVATRLASASDTEDVYAYTATACCARAAESRAGTVTLQEGKFESWECARGWGVCIGHANPSREGQWVYLPECRKRSHSRLSGPVLCRELGGVVVAHREIARGVGVCRVFARDCGSETKKCVITMGRGIQGVVVTGRFGAVRLTVCLERVELID